MTPTTAITALVLAGGAGRRVSGRDKGLILWQGQPLVQHVYRRLAPQVGEIFISCNRNHARYQELGPTVIADFRKHFQGPLAGLEAACPVIKTDYVVVVACDTPHLPEDLVMRLISPLQATGEHRPEISYAHDGSRAQYLCAAIRSECLPSLGDFLNRGRRAVHEWYQSRLSVSVDFSDQPDAFINYNRLN